jgi:hypothetical protein
MVAGTDPGTRTQCAQKQAVPGAEIKSPTTRFVGKKLPWLDGKRSKSVAMTPTKRLGSDTESPSHTTHRSNHKTSISIAPKRPNASPQTVRRKPHAVLPQPRAPSATSSSPSPATRHQLSQARRISVTPKGSLPRAGTSCHISTSHKPQKRLSIAQNHHKKQEEVSDNRRQMDSLAPVPHHLEISETSDSMFQRTVGSSSSPVFTRGRTPLQEQPNLTSIERTADSSMSSAIDGLENMVQKAVDIADKTADRCQAEEIYEIIEDAKAAIQDASAFPIASYADDTSPLVVSSSSERIADKRLLFPNVNNREPVSFDWAYSPERKKGNHKCSPSSSSDNEDRGRSNFSTQSDLLLPPSPTQPIPRDHVDFVLRPIVRDQFHGQSGQRLNGDSAVRHPRHRHRHDSEQGSRSRFRRGQEISSGFSRSDTSFDEENLPNKPYGSELFVRDQALQHTFNYRRLHRRQPIARNWSTGKKRLTATIACINTALLGIIVGIYVSMQSKQTLAYTEIGQAGEVPSIQYYLADESHHVVVGNAV